LSQVLPCWIGSALISTPLPMSSASSPGSAKAGSSVAKSVTGRGATARAARGGAPRGRAAALVSRG
jgi:hypothetical protein